MVAEILVSTLDCLACVITCFVIQRSRRGSTANAHSSPAKDTPDSAVLWIETYPRQHLVPKYESGSAAAG